MDEAYRDTDRLLSRMESRIAREYSQAVGDVDKKLKAFFKEHERKDKQMRDLVKSGKLSEADYGKWKIGQLLAGNRWEQLKDTLADDLLNADKIARRIIDGSKAEVYANNYNYATYKIEHDARVNTSFTLYNKDTVERIMRDDPDLLPPPGRKLQDEIAAGTAKQWEKGQIQSAAVQSVLQGTSIPETARYIAEKLGARSYADAVRYARTAITGAQNAGRQQAFERGVKLGIKMRRTWVATLDSRTRHEHRMLDGQTVDVDKPFRVEGEEIMYPGDPHAAGHLVWNCRCAVISQIAGFERDLSDLSIRNDKHMEELTYQEWKEAKAKHGS